LTYFPNTKPLKIFSLHVVDSASAPSGFYGRFQDDSCILILILILILIDVTAPWSFALDAQTQSVARFSLGSWHWSCGVLEHDAQTVQLVPWSYSHSGGSRASFVGGNISSYLKCFPASRFALTIGANF